ncbi:MAG: hypothetical protein IVW54_16880 [Candidatus Binataceae bacterium]|nr:hypothetical protein [Candidatus Binataceae bacterium]
MIQTLKELTDAMIEGFVLKVCQGQGLMVPRPKWKEGAGKSIVVSDALIKQITAPDWNAKNPSHAIARLTEERSGNKTGWREMGLDGSGDYYLLVQ